MPQNTKFNAFEAQDSFLFADITLLVPTQQHAGTNPHSLDGMDGWNGREGGLGKNTRF